MQNFAEITVRRLSATVTAAIILLDFQVKSHTGSLPLSVSSLYALRWRKKCKLISCICRWPKKGNVDIAFVQSASSSSGHLEVCSLGLYGHSNGLLCCRRAQCNLKQCNTMFLSFTKSSGLLSGQEGAEFALLSLICTADDGMRLLHSKGFFVAPACC